MDVNCCKQCGVIMKGLLPEEGTRYCSNKCRKKVIAKVKRKWATERRRMSNENSCT